MASETLNPGSPGGIDDVVIVGGGVAGLYCALKLAPRPVTILTAIPLDAYTSSIWGQSGFAAALLPDDSPDAHHNDTLLAGAGLAETAVARLLVEDAPDVLHDLAEIGVPFEQRNDGQWAVSRATGHGTPRSAFVKGDETGSAVVATLVDAVKAQPAIRVLEGFVGEQLRVNGRQIVGIVAQDLRGGLADRLFLPSRAVILTTGGAAGLFAQTSNSPQSRGNSISMAARAGAVLSDLEFVQFHPTAMNIGQDPAPIITEALRREGARIVDSAGNSFLQEFDIDVAAASPNELARALQQHTKEGGAGFLDCRDALSDDFVDRYSYFATACQKAGLDPTRQPVPILPVAHFHIGGVHTDAQGRSSLDGLWACGEAAATGSHGAAILTANGILEALTFARRVAIDIQGSLPPPQQNDWPSNSLEPLTIARSDDALVVAKVRTLMSAHVGPIRDTVGLQRALSELQVLKEEGASPDLKNLLIAAESIMVAALIRRESRGSHFRSDFPSPSDNFGSRLFLNSDQIAAALDESSNSHSTSV